MKFRIARGKLSSRCARTEGTCAQSGRSERFKNIFRTEYAIVNVGTLEKLEGSSFDPQALSEQRVIRKMKHGLKVLGSGDLTRQITVKAHVFSKSALEKIQAAGGTAEVIGS